jgi:single-stranded DNA-binding protein
LTGRLVKEHKKMESQYGPYLRNSLAVRAGKDNTTFIDLIFRDKTAELVEKYTLIGDTLGIEGSLSVKNTKDNDGNYKTYCHVNVHQIEFLKKGKASMERARSEQEVDHEYRPPKEEREHEPRPRSNYKKFSEDAPF